MAARRRVRVARIVSATLDFDQRNACLQTKTEDDRMAGRERNMNWDQIRGNWNQAKGELKVKWSKLTDDDLTRIEGERDKLVGRLQELYGYSKEEAEEQVDKLD
jgi:uncharacterized protein YjbJ (UPF0337 family)